MRKEFYNEKQKVHCIFDDEGVRFINPQQEFFYPYGGIDSIDLSLLGVLQVHYRAHVCTYTAWKGEKAGLKEMLKYAKEAMKTAPEAEPTIIDLTAKADDSGLSPEEQLKKLKMDFVQGRISKDEYDAKRRAIK